MEKIIYLEPDDEITSVIDKIKKVNQDQVILVVPKAATILQSIVNLKILKSQTVRLGKAISIVTSDETGRNLASQIGLTVYRDLAKRPIPEREKPVPPKEEEGSIKAGSAVSAAEMPEVPREEPHLMTKEKKEEAEPKPKPKPKPSSGIMDIRPSEVKFRPFKDEKRAGIGLEAPTQKPLKPVKDIHQINLFKKLKIAVIFLLVIALFEGVMAYFLLPKASVNLVLKAEKFDQNYEITAKKDVFLSEETSTIPANVYSVEKEASKDFSTTGIKEVGEKAKGTIILTNETGTDQPLVATTRFVSSQGLVFRSTVAVTVPKAYLDPGGNKINGTTSVSVTADAAGEKYNIGPSNFTIPGLAAAIQSKVYGRSSAAMSGGSTRQIKIVSEADAKKAETELLAEVVNSGKEEALSQTNRDEEIAFDGSAQGIVVAGTSSPVVGTEAELYKYTLKAQIKILTVKKSDYFSILTSKINHEIAADKELLKGELEKTTESKVVSLDAITGSMLIKSHVQAPIVAKMDTNVMKNNIRGKRANDATSYLKAFEEVADAEVSLWPFFSQKVPSPKRIFINTSYRL